MAQLHSSRFNFELTRKQFRDASPYMDIACDVDTKPLSLQAPSKRRLRYGDIKDLCSSEDTCTGSDVIHSPTSTYLSAEDAYHRTPAAGDKLAEHGAKRSRLLDTNGKSTLDRTERAEAK